MKMNVMKKDEIKVITGKDKGKSGKVLSVDPRTNKVTVEGINLAKKHQKPRRRGASGEVVDIPAPIQYSNIQLVCPHCSVPVRPKRKLIEGSTKRQRFCPNCSKYIEKPK